MQPYQNFSQMNNPYAQMNNMYAQPNNPYADRMNFLQNYQQSLQQQPMQMNQQPMPQQIAGINGRIVQAVETINPNEVPMDGSVAFFPKQDLTEIYAKQWGADGSIKTVVYKPYTEPKNSQGYSREEDNRIIIIPKQALAVRSIYQLYLDGKSIHQIALEMELREIESPEGNKNWGDSTILSILKNEKYKGDCLLQKTYSPDFLASKRYSICFLVSSYTALSLVFSAIWFFLSWTILSLYSENVLNPKISSKNIFVSYGVIEAIDVLKVLNEIMHIFSIANLGTS